MTQTFLISDKKKKNGRHWRLKKKKNNLEWTNKLHNFHADRQNCAFSIADKEVQNVRYPKLWVYLELMESKRGNVEWVNRIRIVENWSQTETKFRKQRKKDAVKGHVYNVNGNTLHFFHLSVSFSSWMMLLRNKCRLQHEHKIGRMKFKNDLETFLLCFRFRFSSSFYFFTDEYFNEAILKKKNRLRKWLRIIKRIMQKMT